MKQYKYDDVDAMQELVSDEFGPWSNEVEVTQDMVKTIHVVIEKSYLLAVVQYNFYIYCIQQSWPEIQL